MGVVTRAKKRRLEEEQLLLAVADRISDLSDDILCDIVSLLPNKAGARTQILSSRWRQIWRSAPLNLDLHRTHPPERRRITDGEIAHVLGAHPGPGRRLSIPDDSGYLYPYNRRTTLDDWLRSPALEQLQELELDANRRLHQYWRSTSPLAWPLPVAAVHRFSSTLRVAHFSGFTFPDATDGIGIHGASALHLPVLEQLTLFDVAISQSSLQALLAGCARLQSLVLFDNHGFHQLRIECPRLRSIAVRSRWKGVKIEELFVVDAPCLQRLVFFEGLMSGYGDLEISAPRLDFLRKLFDNVPRLEFSTTVFQEHSVKVLTLSDVKLSLDAIIDLLKCFPRLEELYMYIKAESSCVENTGDDEYIQLIGALDIHLRKIVLANYQGSNKSHVNFAKFFVSNARVLESMRLESGHGDISEAWIARQHELLNIENRASRGARFIFVVSHMTLIGSLEVLHAEQVHNLSTVNPFQWFQYV